ncbi:MAG: hypothetical protein JOY60_00355 [Burkholderiaceae bacterium]|nr:hypothetical protein [Burkholderiaceae bacterium]
MNYCKAIVVWLSVTAISIAGAAISVRVQATSSEQVMDAPVGMFKMNKA